MQYYVEDFGAVGDGVTNDTAALINFVNHAIANPGTPHYLGAKRYKITSPLPVINVSNVWIEGSGAEIHDTGTLVTGTVIAWGGPTSVTGRMAVISSIPGAGNQRVSNVIFRGIGLDCSSGGIGYGLEMLSVQECMIDVAVANASVSGVSLNVVSSLGEAKDIQRNRIRITGRQVEAPGGLVLTCGGDNSSNTSMNEISVDCQHSNLQAIYCNNSDNNDWRFVRCFKVSSGTASECISLLGSNSYAQNTRAERFWFLSCNTPLHAYGSTGSPTFTYSSTGNQIMCLDKENDSPPPVVELGAQVNWREDDSAMDDNAWLSFTPTITALTGTIATVSSRLGFYRKFGKKLEFKMSFVITSNGTGAGAVLATLPFTSVGSNGSVCAGKERSSTGKMLTGYIDGLSSTVAIQFYDGTYPGITGGVYSISGEYEVAS